MPGIALHADPSLNDDVESVVHLAFLDDFLGVRIVLPAAGAQHFQISPCENSWKNFNLRSKLNCSC